MDRKKIIVGVHGIGDQVAYETIQAIAYQFCRYYKVPSAVPLGKFHSEDDSSGCVFLPSEPSIGFTEVYWANIARDPAKEGYQLEETKGWAKTIVERIRSTYTSSGLTETDYRMVKSVLYGAIDTVRVMERLLSVTEKTGIFKFNLNRVLTDFLGDVQIVTEFSNYRGDILERFFSVMDKAYKHNMDADIYIIAHSEGTVVSFLGLLKALSGTVPGGSEWIKNVKGFVTLGSPIDKHLILWPELWQEFKGSGDVILPSGRIVWHNYYDFGDPVGYELDSARQWLKDRRIDVFEFEDKDGEKHDIGFTRYYLPGKAHVDYWGDNDLFDHLIGTVIENPERKDKTGDVKPAPPPTNRLAQMLSYVLPYLGLSALLFTAVYFLYKSVHEFIQPGQDETAMAVFLNVGGIAAILGGMTVMARIPRLTKLPGMKTISFVVFLVSAVAYHLMVEDRVRENISMPLLACPVIEQAIGFMGQFAPVPASTLAVWLLASVVTTLVFLVSGRYPSLRTRPLIVLGGAAVFSIVAYHLVNAQGNPSVWPVFIGSAIFFYMWWLSILIFDLVFIWHRYIRYSKALAMLRKIQKGGNR